MIASQLSESLLGGRVPLLTTELVGGGRRSGRRTVALGCRVLRPPHLGSPLEIDNWHSRPVHALSWNHNTYYQPLVLSHLPDRCDRVLDVGCGRGDFAVRLADRAVYVDALDRSPVMIEESRRTVPGNVARRQADVLDPGLDLGQDAATT